MPTSMPKESEIERKWYVVDAEGKVLGRLATRVATILRGKHKASFSPHLDVGDHVVVLNAEKVQLTGRKLKDKLYRWHTGYIGGLKEVNAETMLRTAPRARHRVGGPGHASRRTGSAARWPRSSRSIAAPSIRTTRSSPSRWRSSNGSRARSLLRHRPPQDLGGPRLDQARARAASW